VFLIILKTMCLLTSSITHIMFVLMNHDAKDDPYQSSLSPVLIVLILYLLFAAYSLATVLVLIVTAVSMKEKVSGSSYSRLVSWISAREA
jgi:hypothetical protein